MIYQVQCTSLYGVVSTWSYGNKHDALCKVRELKDQAGMFLVRVVEIEPQQTIV